MPDLSPAALRALVEEGRPIVEAATPGPWERRIGREGNGFGASQHEQIVGAQNVAAFMVEHDGSDEGCDNIAFAADARTRLPLALDAVAALLDENERLRGDLAAAVSVVASYHRALSDLLDAHAEERDTKAAWDAAMDALSPRKVPDALIEEGRRQAERERALSSLLAENERMREMLASATRFAFHPDYRIELYPSPVDWSDVWHVLRDGSEGVEVLWPNGTWDGWDHDADGFPSQAEAFAALARARGTEKPSNE